MTVKGGTVLQTPMQGASVDRSQNGADGFYWFVRRRDTWAILHRGSCRLAASIVKDAGAPERDYGTWSGPFATRESAFVYIRTMGHTDIRECRLCNPG